MFLCSAALKGLLLTRVELPVPSFWSNIAWSRTGICVFVKYTTISVNGLV